MSLQCDVMPCDANDLYIWERLIVWLNACAYLAGKSLIHARTSVSACICISSEAGEEVTTLHGWHSSVYYCNALTRTQGSKHITARILQPLGQTNTERLFSL